MTVGITPAPADGSIPYSQIEEFTGITDRERIKKVWDECYRDENDDTTSIVIETLLNDRPVMETQGPQNNPVGESEAVQTQTKENDELQKAIALSLKANDVQNSSVFGNQVSREEQDLSRVLEASLADNALKHLQDPLNPHDKIRDDPHWPVGLKNIGNTCWFNAVIQSMFHLDTFRNMVVNYAPRDSSYGELTEANIVSDHSVAVPFMMELRKLFALMLFSSQKYIDPSTAISILRQAFSGGQTTDQPAQRYDQQDVSEFQHKLLDILEKAFSDYTAVSESSQHEHASTNQLMDVDPGGHVKDCKNEMIKLFYGKVKSFKPNHEDGAIKCIKDEDFGQWPLHVDGFKDIHEGITFSLASGIIETAQSGEVQPTPQSSSSSPEQWFTSLPPVFTFELSRLKYNSRLGKAEKLHTPFSFPEVIYFDRYMEENWEEIKEKREKLAKLNNEKLSLENKLSRYTHYGDTDISLPTILRNTSRFTSTVQGCPVHNPEKTPIASNITSRQPVNCTCADCDAPRPEHVTRNEFTQIDSCMHRWLEQVELTISKLEKDIKLLNDDISNMYNKEHLKKHVYHLHAVMVHEGEASAGHYWTYVYDNVRSIWLKYNDISVSSSNWHEVVKEGEGGYGTASAYCLMYINSHHFNLSSDRANISIEKSQIDMDTSLPKMASDSSVLPSPILYSLENLPEDLQMVVHDENVRFRAEIARYDAEQAELRRKEELKRKQHQPNSENRIVGESSIQIKDINTGHRAEQYAAEHAMCALHIINKFMYKEEEPTKEIKTFAGLPHVVRSVRARYYTAAQNFANSYPQQDHRNHFTVYLMLVYGSGIHDQDLYALLVDQVYRAELIHHETVSVNLANEAAEFLIDYRHKNPNFLNEFIFYHEDFHEFRRGMAGYIESMSLFCSLKYEECLSYIDFTITHNDHMTSSDQSGNRPSRSLDIKTLYKIRRQALQHVNDLALDDFESDDLTFKETLKTVYNKIIPIVEKLLKSEEREDVEFVPIFKDKWVNMMLESQDTMEESKMDCLKDFIGQLFDSPAPIATQIELTDIPADLNNRYKKQYQTLMKHADFQEPDTERMEN